METKELIIIGSGPAGLTSAIYAARANLKPLVLAGVTWGGQLMNTTEVENFPGFPEGILGPKLMENMISQAKKFGAEFIYDNATKIEKINSGFKVLTFDKTFLSKSIIIATGAVPKKLNVTGEEKFYGKGVSTCATCDGAFFKNKTIAVVGGGDSAMEESNFLTKFASRVYLIHRRSEFRASKIMQERVKNNPRIEIIFNTEIVEILGEHSVNKIKIKNTISNEIKELSVDGVFLAIGHIPVTDYLRGFIELDESGYVISKDGVNTSVNGVFVAGDVQDQIYRQAITASGAGCRAALTAEKYLASL